MNKPLLTHTQRLRKLRVLALSLSFCVLAPLIGLSYWGYEQLKQDTFSEYEREAQALLRSADQKFFKRLTLSNTLSPSAFDYYQQLYNPVTGQLQRNISPLADLDVERLGAERYIAGLVGYFQYDAKGRFNSPIWPQDLSVSPTDSAAELTFEENTALRTRYQVATEMQHILGESDTLAGQLAEGITGLATQFALAFDLQDYLIFYRIEDSRPQTKLQGYLVKRRPYLQEAFIGMLEKRRFAGPVLITLEDQSGSQHVEHFHFEISPGHTPQITLLAQGNAALQEVPILATELAGPYERYRVTVSTGRIPASNAMLFSGVVMLVLVAVVLAACAGFYRLGLRQLALAEQRLNFVSSVSHELKTPLTSIRMYAEMLREGTVNTSEHRKEYYGLIFSESERLTRLVNNILQLSELSHQAPNLQCRYVQLSALVAMIESKAAAMMDKHGFAHSIEITPDLAQKREAWIDPDAFAQVVINITDNALKFFAAAQIADAHRKKIDFLFRLHPQSESLMQLEIRDYGEGIDPKQKDKVFELFYRGEDELTRTTQGTGIGLALVFELVKAQEGYVEAVGKTPGLAMLLTFQCRKVARSHTN